MTEITQENLKTQSPTQEAAEQNQQQGPGDESSEDTISSLFAERDVLPSDEKSQEKRVRSAETSPKDTSNQDPKASQGKDPLEEKKVKEVPLSSDLETLKQELEKTNKRLAENRQYGRQSAQKLKNALKITAELQEAGTLTSSEAAKLLQALETEASFEDASPSSESFDSPLSKVFAIANQELENIRKYTDDPLLDDKVSAFDSFLMLASKEEQQDVLEELNELADEPIKLTKRMLSLGQQYYDKAYKDIKASGGIQGLLSKKDQEIDKLTKTIDKLTKKLSNYEDFDKPSYQISEMGESEEETPKDSITALFSERDKVKRNS